MKVCWKHYFHRTDSMREYHHYLLMIPILHCFSQWLPHILGGTERTAFKTLSYMYISSLKSITRKIPYLQGNTLKWTPKVHRDLRWKRYSCMFIFCLELAPLSQSSARRNLPNTLIYFGHMQLNWLRLTLNNRVLTMVKFRCLALTISWVGLSSLKPSWIWKMVPVHVLISKGH